MECEGPSRRRRSRRWCYSFQTAEAPLGHEVHERRKKKNKTAKVNEQRRVISKVIEDMQQDKSWTAGTQLHRLGTGLPPAAVLMDSDDKIKETLEGTFGFHPTPMANPRKRMMPFRTCHERNGGLCQRHLLPGVPILAHNVEALAKRCGFAKTLPKMVTFGIDENNVLETHLLCKFFHQPGITLPLLLRCEEAPLHDGSLAFKLAASTADINMTGPKRVVVDTLHRIALRLLHAAARAKDVDAKDVDNMYFKVTEIEFKKHDPPMACFASGTEIFKDIVSCRRTLNMKRKTIDLLKTPEVVVSTLFGTTMDPDLAKDGHDETLKEGHGDDASTDFEDAELKEREDEEEEVMDMEEADDEPPAGGGGTGSGGHPSFPPPSGPGAEDSEPPASQDEGHGTPDAADATEIGLKSFGKAPSGRANCGFCGANIERHAYKFDLRRRRGTIMSHYIRIHPSCVTDIPPEAREGAIAWIRGRLEHTVFHAERVVLLQAAEDLESAS